MSFCEENAKIPGSAPGSVGLAQGSAVPMLSLWSITSRKVPFSLLSRRNRPGRECHPPPRPLILERIPNDFIKRTTPVGWPHSADRPAWTQPNQKSMSYLSRDTLAVPFHALLEPFHRNEVLNSSSVYCITIPIMGGDVCTLCYNRCCGQNSSAKTVILSTFSAPSAGFVGNARVGCMGRIL